MKKILSLMLALSVMTATFSQDVLMDVTHSTGKLTGINFYKTTKSGFVYGVGGSYLINTYTGETRGRYQELSNTYLGNDGSKWSSAFKSNYNVSSFVEDRATVKTLLGFNTKNTTIYSTLGLAFRSEYWRGVGYDAMPGFTSPQKNFYVYRNISPRFLYGINVSQIVTGRWGLNIGWNNVEKLTYGISYKITPTEWFNYE